MTTQPCNPATLKSACLECGRLLHYGRSKYGRRAACEDGHPAHHAHGMCNTCVDRYSRHGIPYPNSQPPTASQLYCPHDEGEPCNCAAELQTVRKDRP